MMTTTPITWATITTWDSLPPDHPTLIEIRNTLRRGDCPICHRKGFHRPLLHITKIHNIPEPDFRDIIGATTRETLCTEESHLRVKAACEATLVPGVSTSTKRRKTKIAKHRLLETQKSRNRAKGQGKGYTHRPNGTWVAYGIAQQGSSPHIGSFRTELAAATAAWVARQNDKQ